MPYHVTLHKQFAFTARDEESFFAAEQTIDNYSRGLASGPWRIKQAGGIGSWQILRINDKVVGAVNFYERPRG